MNIGNIKAFLGGEETVRPDTKINQQLQAEGLKQAREFQQSTTVSSFSSQYSIAYKALSDSLQRNVELDGQKNTVNEDVPDEESSPKLFDFEAVAENVMRFVGSVIRNSAQKGADEDALNDLFSQAREGVSRGIGLAKNDLSGLMSDELSTGIDKAEKAIFSQIDSLEKSIFAPQATEQSVLAANLQTFRGSELTIRTKDGDEIKLSFANERGAFFAQSNSLNQTSGDNTQVGGISEQQSTSLFGFFERSGISLEVSGNLDKDELVAIKDLVEQISNLADEFFNGDVEKAFNQALELGYDKDELVGYALNLTKSASVSAISAYEGVQSYQEEETNQADTLAQRPALQYVSDALNTMEQASKILGTRSDYNDIVTEVINQMDDSVKTPDLLTAINRFHQFNAALIDGAASSSNASKAES